MIFMFMKFMHNPAKKEEYSHLAVNVSAFGEKNLFKYLCSDKH